MSFMSLSQEIIEAVVVHLSALERFRCVGVSRALDPIVILNGGAELRFDDESLEYRSVPLSALIFLIRRAAGRVCTLNLHGAACYSIPAAGIVRALAAGPLISRLLMSDILKCVGSAAWWRTTFGEHFFLSHAQAEELLAARPALGAPGSELNICVRRGLSEHAGLQSSGVLRILAWGEQNAALAPTLQTLVATQVDPPYALSLRRLVLQGVVQGARLAAALPSMGSLESFEMHHPVEELAAIIVALPPLVWALDVSNCTLRPHEAGYGGHAWLAALAQKLPQLEELDISGNAPAVEADFGPLFVALHSSRLHTFRAAKCLQRARARDELLSERRLRELDLSFCGAFFTGGAALAHMGSAHLQKLSLNGSPVTDELLSALARAAPPQLKELRICSAFQRAIGTQMVSDVGAWRLAEAMPAMRALRVLYLTAVRRRECADAAAVLVALALPACSLRRLALEGGRMGVAGATALAQAMARAPKLHSIALAGIPLGTAAAIVRAAAVVRGSMFSRDFDPEDSENDVDDDSEHNFVDYTRF